MQVNRCALRSRTRAAASHTGAEYRCPRTRSPPSLRSHTRGGSAGSSEPGDGHQVHLDHPDDVTGMGGMHGPAVADVDAHVVQIAIPEDQVTRPEVGAADRL